MKRFARIRTYGGALALAAGLMLGVGCGDSVVSQEATPDAQAPISKMRQAHLFGEPGAGKVLERFEELITYTEFILSVDPLVLDLQRVLDRYDTEEGVTIKRVYRKSKGFALHIDANHVARLLDLIEYDNDITWMEPDPKFTQPPGGKVRNMGNGQKKVTYLNQLGWQNRGLVEVDVYLLDTGIAHEDVNVVERVDFTAPGIDVDITRVLERYEDTLDPQGDAIGHGTHVAGILGAADNGSAMLGTAPGVRFHDFQVFDASGSADMSSVVAALDVIQARKAISPLTPMVVNLSLGADIGTTQYSALDEAVRAAIQAGVVVVVAAGNYGIDAATVTPAHVTEAITVASITTNNGSRWEFSPFSNYGAVVDLSAPGEDVESLSLDPTKTVEMTGTSMAAPFVAGAAALYLSQYPLATPQQVRTAIVNTAGDRVRNLPSGTTDRRLDLTNF